MSYAAEEVPHRHPRRTLGWIIAALVLVALTVAVTITVMRWLPQPTPPPEPPPPPICQADIESEVATLTPEQAENASLIAGVAAQRGLAPRAVSIALTTAFQESGLRNLDYGDRDSLGLFQQRPSQGWGTPEEVMDPIYAANKFFDVMETVDNWESADLGDVAQEVQRSGFPDAYDQHIPQARLIASALTGQTPTAWSCMIRDAGAPDPTGFAASLQTAYTNLAGLVSAQEAKPTATPTPQPAALTYQTDSDELAWAVAAFAQSWATRYGIAQVQVGDRSWTAESESLAAWTAASATPAPSGAATTVTIVFAV